jgi:hypothetical protein
LLPIVVTNSEKQKIKVVVSWPTEQPPARCESHMDESDPADLAQD